MTSSTGSGPSRSFAQQEAIEYAYVARDVKDIVRIAALLLVVLFVLYILVDVTKTLTL